MASSSTDKHWKRSHQIPMYMETVETTKNNRNSHDMDPPSIHSPTFSSSSNNNDDPSDSSAEIEEIEGDMQQHYTAIQDTIIKPPPIHFTDEERVTLISVLNANIIHDTPGNKEEEEEEEEPAEQEDEEEEEDADSDDDSNEKSKYQISQLVAIRDAQKFGEIEVVYGIIVDIGPQKMKIEYIYDNESFRTEWFDVTDERVSVVTETQKVEAHESEEQEERDDDVSDDPFINLINIKHEMISLISERQLLNLERDALHREKEKLLYAQKRHEMEVWTLKNDYMERMKDTRKECNVYKEKCDAFRVNKHNEYFLNHFLVTPSELERKEEWITEKQHALDVQRNRAQILYGSATDILQKVQSATKKLEARCTTCDEKSEIEKQLIAAQDRLRQKHLNELNEWLVSCDTHRVDPNLEEWYTILKETHESLREQRRKFTVVQRKLRTLHPQIYDEETSDHELSGKPWMRIRKKLMKMRGAEKEWKLAVCEQIKGLFDDIKMKRKQRVFDIAQEDIMTEYQSQVIGDKERQIRNEDKMLRLQQKNVENAWMELQCEGAFVCAQAEHDTQDEDRYDTMKHALRTKCHLIQDTEAKLQEALHEGDMLSMKLNHFEEWHQERWNADEEKESNYQVLMKAMETLNKEFEQMMVKKDVEMKRMSDSMDEWKDKVAQYDKANINLNMERNTMMQMMDDIKDEHKEKLAHNESLNEQWSVLHTENEELRAQIQALIMKNEEELTRATQHKDKTEPESEVKEEAKRRRSRESQLSLTQSVTETVESSATHEIDDNKNGSMYFVDDSMLDSNSTDHDAASDHEPVFWNAFDHTATQNDDEWQINEIMPNNGNSDEDTLSDLDEDIESISNLSKSRSKSMQEAVERSNLRTMCAPIRRSSVEIKFAKKIKKHHKVQDSRERSFLIMCDENKRIDFDALREYIEHFGTIKSSKKMKKNVKQFLKFMKPNEDGFVSFSKFVHAIDEDGDVVAAFIRFRQTGDPRSKK